MRWTVNNVLKLLRNRLYTGYMETMGRGRRLRSERGSGTWLQTHEAIIEPALFEEVSQGLTARRRAGHTFEKTLTGDFLLKHIAKCSLCGHTLRARQDLRTTRGDGAYYLCAKGLCKNNLVTILRACGVGRWCNSIAKIADVAADRDVQARSV
jgi:hypothetical protein